MVERKGRRWIQRRRQEGRRHPKTVGAVAITHFHSFFLCNKDNLFQLMSKYFSTIALCVCLFSKCDIRRSTVEQKEEVFCDCSDRIRLCQRYWSTSSQYGVLQYSYVLQVSCCSIEFSKKRAKRKDLIFECVQVSN